MKNTLASAFLLTGVYASVFSQVEVSGTVELVSPLGSLTEVYSKNVGYKLSVLWVDKYKKKQKLIGFSLGYFKLKGPQDTLFYSVETNNGTEIGKAYYQDYPAYQLSLVYRNEHFINNFLALGYGVDMGLFFTQYEYFFLDTFQDESGLELLLRYSLSPRVGLKCKLSEKFALNVHSQYAMAIGASDETKMVFNQYFFHGVSLSYQFGN